MQFVGKVIAIGPGGKAQAPARSDFYREVIEVVRGAGWLDQILLSPRCRGYEHADEVRRDLYRSARYYCSCGKPNCTYRANNIDGCPDGGQRISCRADVVTVTETVTDDDGTEHPVKHYHVQFRLFDKKEAIRALIQRYGEDRSKWPYDPWAKKARNDG